MYSTAVREYDVSSRLRRTGGSISIHRIYSGCVVFIYSCTPKLQLDGIMWTSFGSVVVERTLDSCIANFILVCPRYTMRRSFTVTVNRT